MKKSHAKYIIVHSNLNDGIKKEWISNEISKCLTEREEY